MHWTERGLHPRPRGFGPEKRILSFGFYPPVPRPAGNASRFNLLDGFYSRVEIMPLSAWLKVYWGKSPAQANPSGTTF